MDCSTDPLRLRFLKLILAFMYNVIHQGYVEALEEPYKDYSLFETASLAFLRRKTQGQ